MNRGDTVFIVIFIIVFSSLSVTFVPIGDSKTFAIEQTEGIIGRVIYLSKFIFALTTYRVEYFKNAVLNTFVNLLVSSVIDVLIIINSINLAKAIKDLIPVPIPW